MSDAGRIGLVAVYGEILPLVQRMQPEGQEQVGETILHTGSIGGQPVALAEVLLGPVNAALGALALIVHHRLTCLISLGSAGALAGGLSPGDVVIAQRAVAHDAGFFVARRFEPSGVMGRDGQGRVGYRRCFEADPDLVALAMGAAERLGLPVCSGLVVTGNQTIFSTARKRWLRQTFDALAVEMETAAVAQVAVAHRLPWIGVRAISDAAADGLALNYGRLRSYLDDDRPAWRRQIDRGSYLLTHPVAWRRLNRLRHGLALASAQASRLVEAMLQGCNGP